MNWRERFPEAHKHMDSQASEFWAYPNSEWQLNCLEDWADRNAMHPEAGPLSAAISEWRSGSEDH